MLIGRALGQQTGYLAGVGFRIRDDGYVEGEFDHGTETFRSFGDFEKAVKSCLRRISDDSDSYCARLGCRISKSINLMDQLCFGDGK